MENHVITSAMIFGYFTLRSENKKLRVENKRLIEMIEWERGEMKRLREKDIEEIDRIKKELERLQS